MMQQIKLMNSFFYMDVLAGLYALAPFGPKKLRELAAAAGVRVTLRQAEEFTKLQESYSETRQQSGHPRHYKEYTAQPHEAQQMDLLSMQADFAFAGYKFILCVIDIGSRYALAAPLKTKKAAEVAEALERLQREGLPNLPPLGIPSRMECDQGPEFYGATTAYLERNRIFIRWGEPENHRDTSIIERFNQTLSRALNRLIDSDNRDWPAALPGILHAYNTTTHRTIRKRPLEVFTGEAAPNRKITHVDEQPLKAGTLARALMYPPSTGRRIHSELWSPTVYALGRATRAANGVIGYRLYDPADGSWLSRIFYRHELQIL